MWTRPGLLPFRGDEGGASAPEGEDRAAQADFGDGEAAFDWRCTHEAHYLVPTPDAPEGGHTADSIRAQVTKIMAIVRAAQAMPFAPDELRNHTVWMPYYCEWLKNGEGDALLAEFREHVARLSATD